MTAIIAVQDSGIGISPEFLPHAFDEFKQESTGLARSYEGNGLGLTISRALARKLGGDITISSERTVGTVVKIIFPLSAGCCGVEEKQYALAPNHQPQESPPDRAAAKVLLVEDTKVTAELVGMFLRQSCDLTFVSSSSEALAACEKDKFAAIIMDVNLGSGPDGIYTTREIRRSELNAGTPILALTAYATEQDRKAALLAGCNDYLSKPFARATLQMKVDSMLHNFG